MTRSSALLICLILAACVHFNAATTNGDIVKQNVTQVVKVVQVCVEELKGDITSQVTGLTRLVEITAIITLVNELRADLLKIVAVVKSAAGTVLGKALSAISTAVETIKNAIEEVIPMLNDIATALGELLKKVLELVDFLLQAVVDLLAGLTSKLHGVLQDTLVSLLAACRVYLKETNEKCFVVL